MGIELPALFPGLVKRECGADHGFGRDAIVAAVDSAVTAIEIAGAGCAAELAAIHAEALPADFLPALGLPFLATVYYPKALSSRHATTFVAVREGSVAGFVTVAADADAFIHAVVSTSRLEVLKAVVARTVENPGILIRAARMAIAVERGIGDVGVGEIVFIAVRPQFRGQGIGGALISVAQGHAAASGVERCRTITLRSNEDVIRLYRRFGWNLGREFDRAGCSYVTLLSPLLREGPA